MNINQPNQQMQFPIMQVQQPKLHINASLPYDESIESQPDGIDEIEKFYIQAFIQCENYFQNDQISKFNSSPTFIPNLNSCFLVKKKDNKTRNILHNMCVSYQDTPKRQTITFKYIDGRTPNEIKVRIVEAHNVIMLSKIGVTNIKQYYLVHSYYSRQSGSFNGLDKNINNPQYQNINNQINNRNFNEFNQNNHQDKLIAMNNNQNIINSGLNIQQIGQGDKNIQNEISIQNLKYPMIEDNISIKVSNECIIKEKNEFINQDIQKIDKNEISDRNQNKIEQNNQHQQVKQKDDNIKIEELTQKVNQQYVLYENLIQLISQQSERIMYQDEMINKLQDDLKLKDKKLFELEQNHNQLQNTIKYINQSQNKQEISQQKVIIEKPFQMQRNINDSQTFKNSQNFNTKTIYIPSKTFLNSDQMKESQVQNEETILIQNNESSFIKLSNME